MRCYRIDPLYSGRSVYYGIEGTSTKRKEQCLSFLSQQVCSNGNEYQLEVVKAKMVGAVCYAAVKMKAVFDGYEDGKVIAVVIPTIITTKKRCSFTCKWYSENMLPAYFDCPADILELLSDTTNTNAIMWRKLVKQRLETQTLLSELPDGSVIDAFCGLGTLDALHLLDAFNREYSRFSKIKLTKWHGKWYEANLMYGLPCDQKKIYDVTLHCS